MNNFRVLYSNINGLQCKLDSLLSIIEEKQPTIVALVETKLAEKEEFEVPGYVTKQMNRDENGGGIMLLVKEELKNIIVEVDEKKEVGEAKWVAIDNGRNRIRLGILYAPQENKTTIKQLKVMYKGLKDQIWKAKKEKQEVLLLGDFNCKVGDAVPGNTEEVTKGGKILIKMVDKLGMELINAREECEGIWTRVEKNKKSVLDYVVMGNEGAKLVKRMVIDEEREITPFNGNTDVYTDHNSVLLDINWNIRYQPGEHKVTRINETTNEEFRRRTEETKFVEMVEEDNLEVLKKYSGWSESVREIAEEVYVVKKKKIQQCQEIIILQKKRKQLGEDFVRAKTEGERTVNRLRRKMIDGHIINIRKEGTKRKAEQIAQDIKKESGFDGGAFYEYKRRQQGKKEEARMSIKDKKGNLVEKPNEIKKVYRDFYEELLQEKEIDEDGKEMQKIVDQYTEIMERIAAKESMEAFTQEEYEEVLKKLKKRKAPDKDGWRYEMVIYAGKDLKMSILKMINKLVEGYTVPKEWRHMIIKSIYKGKGEIRSMDSKRGLFLTNIISKLVEKLMKNRTKKEIDANMTPFQCGGVTERSIVDHLLTVNSWIAEQKAKKEDGYLMFADLEKCFDKLWLRDCIKEMCEAGMPIPEAVYVLKMNQDVTAEVNTPFGISEPFQAKEIVRQGTIWGPQLCSVTTDRINKMEDDVETRVNGVIIKSPVFVDDMNGMGKAEGIENMGRKMDVLETTKKFSFNNGRGKTEILPIEFQNCKKKKAVQPPIVTVKKGEVSFTEAYKFLGDWYDKQGSNIFKIQKKMERLKHVVSEVKKYSCWEMVGDADVEVRMLLLEIIVKATLLFNTESWVGVGEKEEKELQKYHYEVLRKSFEQKQSTPYYGIIAETGIWPYKYVIVYKRLMLLHHLIHSSEERISRKLILNQKGIQQETWYTGVDKWLEQLRLETETDVIKDITKSGWKKMVKDALQKVIEIEVMQKAEEMTKMRFVKKFEKREYLTKCNMATVKDIMKIRLNMVEVGENFRGKYPETLRDGASWCLACNVEKETTEHVIECNEYRKLTGHTMEITENCFEETEWLIQATKAYDRIEETRKILVRCYTKRDQDISEM